MKLLKSALLTVLLFAGIVLWKSSVRQTRSDDSIGRAVTIVESVPEYGQNQAFFDSRIAEHHERAFKIAYISGRFKSSLDEKSYQIILLTGRPAKLRSIVYDLPCWLT